MYRPDLYGVKTDSLYDIFGFVIMLITSTAGGQPQVQNIYTRYLLKLSLTCLKKRFILQELGRFFNYDYHLKYLLQSTEYYTLALLK